MTSNTNTPAPSINEQQTLNIPYSVQSQDIQIEMRNGEPWFAAADICNILDIGNTSDALRRLDEDERLTSVVTRAGQAREMNFVSESGLYNLIFQSRKPEAKRFRKWVTAEVLPSIRRTGGYKAGAMVQGSLFGSDAPNMAGLVAMLRQQEADGHTWYSATDLLTLSGKQRSGNCTRKCEALAAKGLARKLCEGNSTVGKWYIRQDAISLYNGYKPQDALKSALASYLNQGGANV